MKLFKHNHLYKSLLLSLCAITLFAACKTEAEFDGDILEAINADTSSVISFKKDKNSPVAFELSYSIGGDYTLEDLPGNDDEKVDQLNPGFDLIGWKLDDADNDLRSCFNFDAEGCVSSFHMGTRSITLYGAGYTASTDTPYKIVYKTQNLAMTGYEVHSEQILTGTTSTPDAPSYTDATNHTIDIPGFSVRIDLLNEEEIAADGSTIVEVFYDRCLYSLIMHANDGTGASELTELQTFYYQVTAQLTPNTFTRSGYSFAGWATTRERADAGTVDYTDGANYTIGVGDADLYAVWTLPHISVTIDYPDEYAVHPVADTTSDPDNIILSAYIPTGHSASEYTFDWFYTNEGYGNVRSHASSWSIPKTSLTPGYYQITLIAVHTVDSMPSGGTIQIQVGD